MQFERGTRLDEYEILEAIGAGGMGEVYRARDTSLDRDVAIKVLPSDVAGDSTRRARFEREAKSVAALNHENIVTIHTIGEDDGIHYLAMELIEGETLDRRIPADGLATDDLLALAIPVVSALKAAHDKGIIHRDLKPANVMVTREGKVKVLDFGLAKLAQMADDPLNPVSEHSETATMTLQTQAGKVVGTMPYMSPEQLSGKEVGPASDLFSFGVVLYEMATGTRPFQGTSGPTLISSILTEAPQPVGELSPALPDALGRLIERCLAKDPDDRPAGADRMVTELTALRNASSLSAVQPGIGQRGSNRGRWAAIAIALAVTVALVAIVLNTAGRERRVRNETLPEVQRLFDEGDEDAAFRLLREASEVIPDDPLLIQIAHGNMMPFWIETEPSGAEVFLNSYADLGRSWVPLGTTPVEPMMPVAAFRFRIEHPGFETYEGSGLNLSDAVKVRLTPEGSAPPGMVRIPQGSAQLGDPRPVKLDGFWLDRFEVTNAEFKEFVDAGGYKNPDHWLEPISVNGRELPFEEAVSLFVDTTGRPGPATWELGTYPDGTAEHPVGGVSWYEAAAFAAWAGKSLPTVFHWRRAAEQGILSDIITVSNFDGKGPAPVGSYGGIGPFGTYDMAGNVREWCLNRLGAARYSLGGAWSDPSYRYRDSDADDPLDRAPKNGFRCMKTEKPMSSVAMAAVDMPVFDYSQLRPVSDEIFKVLLSQFAYDKTDLEPRIEAVDESSDHWRRERITFKSGYGDERVPANLYLPKNASPPYQTIVFFPSSAALAVDNSLNPGLFIVDFIIRSGRAFMYPVYKGTYERRVKKWSSIVARDVTIQQSKDLGRAIDYLETRDDIDASKLAFCGLSWGGAVGPIFTAVDDRFKASVLLAGGMNLYPPDRPPESIPVNFMPRSTVPVLMVNGREDFLAPVETELKPMFDFQGAPPEHKKLVILSGGHVPDNPKEFVRAALDWLDLYLGPVD